MRFSFEPMLCESAERPPEGREWRYELKLDGFRAIGRKSGRSAQLWSRNQKDFTRRFPNIVKAISELSNDTVIDGEIVALDAAGKPSFNLLQGIGIGPALIVMYAFDLLMWQGKDVRPGSSKSAGSNCLRSSGTYRIPFAFLRRSTCRFRIL
jgi:ATP-dependent DNA ligase